MPAKRRVHRRLLQQEEDTGKGRALLQTELIQRQSRIKLNIQDEGIFIKDRQDRNNQINMNSHEKYGSR